MIPNIASYIDHTILRANATVEEVDRLCKEAVHYSFASVCINPIFVSRAASILSGTSVKTCTVVGFPLGALSTKTKMYETRVAIEDGATEIDMVISIGHLKSGLTDFVYKDILSVVEAAEDAVVKVIIEACLLTESEKRVACELAQKAGADFVKTSTGFSTGGATIEDVKLMRSIVGKTMGVKAAGGIRDLKTSLAFIEAGASRLGTSNGISIIKEVAL